MKRRLERVAAQWICNVLVRLSSQRICPWAEGLRIEVSGIRDDREALHYALSGMAGLLPRIILGHAQAMIGMRPAVPGAEAAPHLPLSKNPQTLGVLCAIVSTLLGVLYLASEGAPLQYIIVNLTALVIGLAALALVRRIGAQHIVSPGPAIFLMAALVLLTSLLGRSAEGAARWIDFGPVTFQTSLLVLPAALVLFVRSRSRWSTIGVAMLALAVATQPDRAMACALFIGLSVVALHQFDRRVALAFGVAFIGACVTLAMPDTLSPAPYVDGVYADAFASGPVAALLAVAGVIALLGPAIGLSSARGPDRTTLLTFLSVWSVIGLAAAVGNFPTPFVGYGASSIIGYLLCLAALPERLPVSKSGASPETAVGQSENENGASISVESRVQNHARPGSPRRLQLLSASCLAIFGMGSAAGQAPPDVCGRTEVEKVEIPNTIWQPGPGGEQIPLWPDDVKLRLPHYDGNLEMTGTGSPLIAGRTWSWATYISRPTMTIYAPKGENTGAAMLVLPGGGYAAVAMDLEGTEICDWITQHGVTCIVLKYRVPQIWRRNESGSVVPPDNFFALEDAQRAMSLLRDGASAYSIDPKKIGVIGFSAGAHLAAALSNADERTYTPVDAVDNQPTRPDFAIVLYPGRFLPRGNVGTDLSLGSWVEISAQAPPTLLFHAMNDSSNDVRNSIAYGLALDEVGVPVDMRFFAGGCHAFGLRPAADPIATDWPVQAVQWLGHIGIL
jgi:acetyl esterase/lipase